MLSVASQTISIYLNRKSETHPLHFSNEAAPPIGERTLHFLEIRTHLNPGTESGLQRGGFAALDKTFSPENPHRQSGQKHPGPNSALM
jgi:hypothetical protein